MGKRRPKVLDGTTERVQTNCGGLYVTLNKLSEGTIFEVILQLGKTGNCQNVLIEQLALSLSIMLQENIETKDLIAILKRNFVGVSCGNAFNWDGVLYKSCIDITAQRILTELEKPEEKKE